MKIIQTTLNILYPRHCPVCHRILLDQNGLACPECRNVFQPINRDYCLKCGKPVKPEEEYCPECRKHRRIFDQGRCGFAYTDRMRQSLLRYKYYGSREYSTYYGIALCRILGETVRQWNPDVIIPIPLYPRTKRMRGFNQAEELAGELGKNLHIPVATDILVKVRETRSQKKLSAEERKQNLQGAFHAKQPVKGLTILLADDVYTTGSTMETAALCLREAGAEKVYFVTLAAGDQVAVKV